MTHWGWYWKVKKQHKPKRLCSEAPCINASEVCKEMARDITQRKPVPNACTVRYDNKNYTVAIDKQPVRLGGFNYFFLCPLCNKRMKILYCLECVACRGCLRLCYTTQRLRASERNLFGTAKLEKRLEIRGGSLSIKPKGMHKTTWKLLKGHVIKYELKYEDALCRELREYYPKAAGLF